MSGHPSHPTKNDWHPECAACWNQVCATCGHLRSSHSRQWCLAHDAKGELIGCECRVGKETAADAFRDPVL